MATVAEAQKDREAREIFVQENLGLVRTAIKKLGFNCFDDDYFQEGCIGLLNAIDRYDPAHGTEFSTYAIPVVQGAVRKYKRDYELDSLTGVKVSRPIKETYTKLKRLEEKGLDDDSICEKLKLTKKRLNIVRFFRDNACTSLNKEVSTQEKANKKSELHELIADPKTNTENMVIESIAWKELIVYLSKRIEQSDFEILRLRMQGLSQCEIGEKIGVSQVQVSRRLTAISNIVKEYSQTQYGLNKEKPGRITAQELFEECKVLGTKKDAQVKIAQKYGMKEFTIRNKIYNFRINKLIEQEVV